METVSHNVVKGQSSSNLERSGNSSSTAELVVKYALNFKGFDGTFIFQFDYWLNYIRQLGCSPFLQKYLKSFQYVL